MIINSPYSPLPAQLKAHKSPKKNLLYLAGIGGAKTSFGVNEMLRLAAKNPNCNGFIGAPTYPMIRDVIISAIEEWIPKQLWTWKRGDNRIELWNGQKWFLGTATNPDAARGKNVGYAWIDEAAMIMSRRFWDIVAGRVRDPRTNFFRMMATTTPRGYNWLIDIFLKGGPDYFLVRSKTRDNIHLPDDFEPGLRALYGDEFADEELDAKIKMLKGMAYPYNAAVHLMPIGEMLRRVIYFIGGVDWGFTNPACLIVAGIDHDGRLYLIDEWYKSGQMRETIAAKAKEFSIKYGVKIWYADHDPEGVAKMERNGLNVKLAEKEIIPGVQYTRSLFPVRSDGEPRIYISRNMKKWIYEQSAYQFPPSDPSRPPSEKNEVPVGAKGDHAMDASRYIAYTNSLTSCAFEYRGIGQEEREII